MTRKGLFLWPEAKHRKQPSAATRKKQGKAVGAKGLFGSSSSIQIPRPKTGEKSSTVGWSIAWSVRSMIRCERGRYAEEAALARHPVLRWPKVIRAGQGAYRPLNGPIPIVPVGTKRNAARYLCHLNNPEKHRYNESDVLEFQNADYADLKTRDNDKYGYIGEMMDFVDEQGSTLRVPAALCPREPPRVVQVPLRQRNLCHEGVLQDSRVRRAAGVGAVDKCSNA